VKDQAADQTTAQLTRAVEMVVGKTEVDPGNNLSGVRNEGERSPSIYFSCAENRCL
jgi:hypothetical protein